MIWQSELKLPFGNNVLYLEMADSILAAVQNRQDFDQPYFHPVIRISHDDEGEVRRLFERLYGESGGTLFPNGSFSSDCQIISSPEPFIPSTSAVSSSRKVLAQNSACLKAEA